MSEPEHLSNPHDKFFRWTFGKPPLAASFFQGCLPRVLSERIQWEDLALQPSNFLDEHLKGKAADLLFSVPLEQDTAFLHCLFEHQSTPSDQCHATHPR
ncbi:MAG: Rpn family recombination-promoting nuclease/putative transposase [Verrucomicrobia bacterium]|nr:Rpn family recombination-promoting nuclease/putative transposase [Verrucomicrobiota bacterium]MCH8511286.1 Rpn family recombination-promoting nuclease/putative transposase [Kiritimatiellia bacterium]